MKRYFDYTEMQNMLFEQAGYKAEGQDTIHISDNKTIPLLPAEGREAYLGYHRAEILKK